MAAADEFACIPAFRDGGIEKLQQACTSLSELSMKNMTHSLVNAKESQDLLLLVGHATELGFSTLRLARVLHEQVSALRSALDAPGAEAPLAPRRAWRCCSIVQKQTADLKEQHARLGPYFGGEEFCGAFAQGAGRIQERKKREKIAAAVAQVGGGTAIAAALLVVLDLCTTGGIVTASAMAAGAIAGVSIGASVAGAAGGTAIAAGASRRATASSKAAQSMARLRELAGITLASLEAVWQAAGTHLQAAEDLIRDLSMWAEVSEAVSAEFTDDGDCETEGWDDCEKCVKLHARFAERATFGRDHACVLPGLARKMRGACTLLGLEVPEDFAPHALPPPSSALPAGKGCGGHAAAVPRPLAASSFVHHGGENKCEVAVMIGSERPRTDKDSARLDSSFTADQGKQQQQQQDGTAMCCATAITPRSPGPSSAIAKGVTGVSLSPLMRRVRASSLRRLVRDITLAHSGTQSAAAAAPLALTPSPPATPGSPCTPRSEVSDFELPAPALRALSVDSECDHFDGCGVMGETLGQPPAASAAAKAAVSSPIPRGGGVHWQHLRAHIKAGRVA